MLVITPAIAFLLYGDVPKIFPIMLAFVDTILMGFNNWLKPQRKQYTLQETNQKLLNEYNWYITLRGPYAAYVHSPGHALDLFLDRTEQAKNEGFQAELSQEKVAPTLNVQGIHEFVQHITR